MSEEKRPVLSLKRKP
ncbi:TPA: hypothetical protein ACGEF7_005621, partial [Klebsiella pneumoniae]|nr:hypothetical protein [Klebsiella pneumoniae]HCI6692663.1 hypothetical protein [Klebsiella pneumoniae]